MVTRGIWACLLAGLLVGVVSFDASFATCTGGDPCNACKNCRYCKRCAQEGGTCGVCKRAGLIAKAGH